MNWKAIMLHHSATPDGRTFSWQAIRRYHTQHNGWLDIGYHFGIELVRDEYEVLVGRPLSMPGAHCKGMNTRAIGVCFVGNYDEIEPPEEMLRIAIHRLIGPLMVMLGIPSSNILYHRDYAVKTCPGTKFSRALVDRYLAEWLLRNASTLWNGPTGNPI